MKQKKNSFPLEKLQNLLDFPSKHLGKWLMKRQSQAILHLPNREELIQKVFKKCVILLMMMKNSLIARKKIFSILEFPLKNKWMIFLDKLNISNDQNMLLIYLFKILVQELILKEKVYSPFWTVAYKELSEKLSLPTEIGCVGSHMNSLNPLSTKQEVLSKYLTVNSIEVPKMNLQKICYPLSTSLIVDKWKKEVTKEKTYKTIKIQIYPTKQQKSKIEECISVHRYIYNRTVEYITKNGYEANFMDLRDLLATENTKKFYSINKYYSFHINKLKDQIKNSTNDVNKEYLRNQLKYEESLLKEELNKLKYTKNPMILPFELNVSNEIRSNAIKSVCDAYKTGFTNLKNGNVKFFRINYKKKTEKRKCIELANSEINIVNGEFKICPGKFKEHSLFSMGKRNKEKYKNLEIKHNCDLLKINNKYYINVTVPINNNKTSELNNFCGVDPGIRKFATVYNNGCIYEYDQTKTMSLLDKLNNKIKFLKSFKTRRIKKEKFTKIEVKKSNIVNELHWLVINDLIRNNDLIFYGDIKSHDIVKDGKNKKLNRDFNDLKFYIFKQRLKYKAMKNGKIVHLINESYTTQGCSKCGNLCKTIGKSEIYECQICELKTGRDINASKNICMKGLMKILQ